MPWYCLLLLGELQNVFAEAERQFLPGANCPVSIRVGPPEHARSGAHAGEQIWPDYCCGSLVEALHQDHSLTTTSAINHVSPNVLDPVAKPPTGVAGFASLLAPMTGATVSEQAEGVGVSDASESAHAPRPLSRTAPTPSPHGHTLLKEAASAGPTLKDKSLPKDASSASPLLMMPTTPTLNAATPAKQANAAESDDDPSARRLLDASSGTALHGNGSAFDPRRNLSEALSDSTSLNTVLGEPSAAEPPPGAGDSKTQELVDRPTAPTKAVRARRESNVNPGVSEPVGSTSGITAGAADPGLQGGNQAAPLAPGQSGLITELIGRPVGNAAGNADVPSPGDAASAAPQQPAGQLGQALATIHATPEGSSQLRIVLNPAELGSVQVRITRTHDGVSSVSVAVERPETLRSLQTDLSHLHQALDRAGLPEQRSIVLHLATPDGGFSGLPANAQGGDGHGAAQGGSQQNPQRDGPQASGNGQSLPGIDDACPPQTEIRWQAVGWHRAGINITA